MRQCRRDRRSARARRPGARDRAATGAPAARASVPDLARHRSRARRPRRAGRDRWRRGVGRVRRAARPVLRVRVGRRRAGRDPRVPRPAPARRAGHRADGRGAVGAGEGPSDGQGRARDGRARRRAPRRAACRSRPHLGATRDAVECGCRVGIAGLGRRAARRGRRVRRRGLPAGEAQDPAGLGRRAGRRGPRAVRRRPAPGRRERLRTRSPTRRHLAALDAFDLLLIEQPLRRRRPRRRTPSWPRLDRDADLPRRVDHVGARRAATRSSSARARSCASSRAGSAATSKRVRVHDVCREHGVAVWCGGMLETGLGRAANLALAALPGFTLPGDLVRVRPLLRPRPHRAVRARRRPARAFRPAPASASHPTPTRCATSPRSIEVVVRA